jgi:cell division protease FtsH
VALGRQGGGVFLGRDIASDRDFSNRTAAAIDQEVSALVDQAYQRAKDVLVSNRIVLDKIAEMLVEKETVDAEELQNILTHNDVRMAALA